MITFFLIYAVFGSMLTLISFLTRKFLSNTKIRVMDIIKVCLLCIPENVVLSFIMAWTRIFDILFYRGKKQNGDKLSVLKYDEDIKI